MFNVQKKIQGWCDSPLTELGYIKLKWQENILKRIIITFDHAYSSTSERCCDTLELITDMPYTRIKYKAESMSRTVHSRTMPLSWTGQSRPWKERCSSQ